MMAQDSTVDRPPDPVQVASARVMFQARKDLGKPLVTSDMLDTKLRDLVTPESLDGKL